jgi:hypothetical protein
MPSSSSDALFRHNSLTGGSTGKHGSDLIKSPARVGGAKSSSSISPSQSKSKSSLSGTGGLGFGNQRTDADAAAADIDVDEWLHDLTTSADLSTEPLTASTTSPPGLLLLHCMHFNAICLRFIIFVLSSY